MRYWGFLGAKLLLGAGVMRAVWELTRLLEPPVVLSPYRSTWFAQDLRWTTAALVFTLLCALLLRWIVADQKMRCRKCARRLRMPLETGSWSHLLLTGPPRLEYICPYGHGTLRVPEYQVTGPEPSDWKQHDDYWTELTNTRK